MDDNVKNPTDKSTTKPISDMDKIIRVEVNLDNSTTKFMQGNSVIIKMKKDLENPTAKDNRENFTTRFIVNRNTYMIENNVENLTAKP